MKIAINTKKFLTSSEGADEGFLNTIFTKIVRSHPEHEFIFVSDQIYEAAYLQETNTSFHAISLVKNNPLFWNWWLNFKLPAALKKLNADILISAYGASSINLKIPQVIFIHHLKFILHPELISKTLQFFYKRNLKKGITKVKNIIVRSHFLKVKLNQLKKLNENVITLITGAPRKIFKPVEQQVSNDIRDRYTSGTGYFIYVGEIYPQYNLLNLLKAFSVFKKRQKSSMKLVLAGLVDEKSKAFLEILKKYKYREDIVIINQPDDTELALILASAYAYINPCINEGFSLTLIEAMACQIPVITIPFSEMEAESVLAIDPENVNDIADKMMLIYKDENLRSDLIKKGNEETKKFDWDKAAQLVWESIEKAIR